MHIRHFRPDDAETCFKLRSNAYIQKFYDELAPREIAAAVNAYMPRDYVRMAQEIPVFMVEKDDLVVGFFTLKRLDTTTAELPLIYIDLAHLGQGIGSACIAYAEGWLQANWAPVTTLVVDTIIPNYNRGFYEKMGFAPAGETLCEFQGHRVKALRLIKRMQI
jgi:GNAT superfamily N-acetyltransferase